MPISLTLAESWTKLARAATRFITPKDNGELYHFRLLISSEPRTGVQFGNQKFGIRLPHNTRMEFVTIPLDSDGSTNHYLGAAPPSSLIDAEIARTTVTRRILHILTDTSPEARDWHDLSFANPEQPPLA
jgi:hypothetical protein